MAKIKDSELQQVIAEVAASLDEAYKKSTSGMLAKADGEASPEEKASAPQDSAPSATPDSTDVSSPASAPPAASSPPAAASASAPPMGAPAPDASMGGSPDG